MIDFDSERFSRNKKLKILLDKKQNPFNNHFVKEKSIISLRAFADLTNEELTKKEINCRVAGRIMQIRNFGKLIFAQLVDENGYIQVLVDEKRSNPECFDLFKNFDRGDIIGINQGTLIKSKTNELTILLLQVTLLAKALEPLPEKYHGLTDVETRYRQRYLDLIVNSNIQKTFRTRSKIINNIRMFLNQNSFMEVETPILQNLLTGAAALPFKTYHNALKIPLYLRVAPELYLKRLIVGGFERVYEIGRLFRNEGLSPKHNPEFTAIEIYQAYADMSTMMELTENIIKFLLEKICSQKIITFQNYQINLYQPFQRASFSELVYKVTKIDFNKINTFAEAQKLAKEHDISLAKHQNSVGHILNLFFEKYVEKTLIEPIFVYEYPLEISPFAKRCRDKANYTERFELFIGGWEFANAFSELNDPIEQRQRFMMQAKERNLGNPEANEIDEDYLLALKYGMPPTGGLGIGIDRLVMLFTNQNSIKDVILFPTLKPK